MEYIKTDFSRELSTLLKKHRKTFTSDNKGIYVINDPAFVTILIGRATTATDDSRDQMMFLRGEISLIESEDQPKKIFQTPDEYYGINPK